MIVIVTRNPARPIQTVRLSPTQAPGHVIVETCGATSGVALPPGITIVEMERGIAKAMAREVEQETEGNRNE